MKTVEALEAIRRAYFIEGKSIRTISRELRHGRTLVRKAIAHHVQSDVTTQFT